MALVLINNLMNHVHVQQETSASFPALSRYLSLRLVDCMQLSGSPWSLLVLQKFNTGCRNSKLVLRVEVIEPTGFEVFQYF